MGLESSLERGKDINYEQIVRTVQREKTILRVSMITMFEVLIKT